MPKVSVIVPIYNVEKHIARCAKSLFEQTLDDIEYIFVNDCTPDNSMEILHNVLDDYPHRNNAVKIINHTSNKGQAGARISGIINCTGDYIIHCDSDDWVELTAYETLYNFAVTNNSDIVYFDYFIAHNEIYRTYIKQNNFIDKLELFHNYLINRNIGALWCHLVKNKIVKEIDIRSPKYNLLEDLVLIIQYALKAKKISHFESGLYNYYYNPNSIVNKTRSKTEIYLHTLGTCLNSDIIYSKLENIGPRKDLRKEIIAHKFMIKSLCLGVANEFNGCKFWKSIYPEINFHLYFNKYISFTNKVKSLLIQIYIYPIIYKIFR